MAREVLEKELTAARESQTDHELTGRLERLLRRAGAEDVVILVSDGRGPPVPAEGRTVGPHTSVVVAIEYNGHWAKVTRNLAGVTSSLGCRARRGDAAARDSLGALLVGEPGRRGDPGRRLAATGDPRQRSTPLLRRYLSAGSGRAARSMNMVEKILARKSGQKSVAPGDVVVTDIDLMVMHDLSANFVMKVFNNEMEGASIARPREARLRLRPQLRPGHARRRRGSGGRAQVRGQTQGQAPLRQRLRQHPSRHHGGRPGRARHDRHRLRLAHAHLRGARCFRHRRGQQLDGRPGLRARQRLVQGSRDHQDPLSWHAHEGGSAARYLAVPGGQAR